ncbi:hypothetical protein [Ferrimonas lipolytica]|uniref:Uncharacterized protein n=1 Tax=Ferrimonas lipolytica TaxID=2724191 RepID=A0A6H1UC92_9GAMM|nr:hypothetical protein [Ferrimonas lipolytica]QIZ76681.1 hypothetical protein HER31_07235 [Ferrimonas lipolytica]
MAGWLKRILDNGLIQEAKPLMEQHQEVVDNITSGGQNLLRDYGVLPEPDGHNDPLGALEYRLHQLVRHLFQLPKSEAFFLVSELVGLLPTVLAMHPKLRGLAGLSQVLGWQGNTTKTGKITSIAGALGGSPWLARVAQGGQGVVNGQQAYQQAKARERRYEQLNRLQQQVADLSTMLLALSRQSPVDSVSINQGITELERLLQTEFVQLVDGLDSEHGAALNSIAYGPWQRLRAEG